jgi:hypothetical protein
MEVLLLVHVPPAVLLVRLVDALAHCVSVPAIAAGKGFIVITEVVLQPVDIV